MTELRFRSRLATQAMALVAMLAAIAGVLSLVGTSDGPSVLGVTQGRVVDNGLSRADATAVWNATLAPLEVAAGSTGSVAGCQPGAVSGAYRDDQLARVNAFRRFAGLSSVGWSDGEAAMAQQAALWVAANGVDHRVDPSSICFAAAQLPGGRTANESSLLTTVGRGEALRSYVMDWGTANNAVPHRDWILMPNATSVGAGVVGNGHALRFSYGAASGPTAIPWPPAGEVPYGLTYSKWSLSLDGHDVRDAVVQVSRNGVGVTTNVLFKGDGNTGPLVVFALPDEAKPSRSVDTRYDVTVSGLRRNGESISYSWTTTVFNPGQTVTPPATSGVLSENVIRALYRDLAYRQPSSQEIARAASNSRYAVIEGLVGGEAWVGGYVDSIYQTTMGRAADPEGRQFWTTEIAAGRQSIETAVANFYAADEYRGRFESDEAWMGHVIESLLGRPADAGGRSFWTGQIQSLGGRGAAVLALYRSEESRATRVDRAFVAILGRQPDARGRQFYVEQLLRISDLRMAALLADSPEYEARNS